VKQFRAHWLERIEGELDYYRQQPTLQDATREAGMARLFGKRHPHQRRLKLEALRRATAALLSAPLDSCASFDDVHAAVDAAIRPIAGIGELMVYDASHRIAAWMGLEPVRVYLHAGTRKGARALGLDGRSPYIEVRDLPRALRSLTPAQAEDFLCIYKSQLGELARA